jgi:hypothetical protein
MKYNFCTLFDSAYLSKGLALYESLCTVCEEFHLYVVAFDNECYEVLINLNLSNLTVISLLEFETLELLEVKPTRNRAEYCWTSGPSAIYHCIQKYELDHCTYIDADIMFFSSPSPIYEEIGNNSIALTEHFTEDIDELGGRFCVQFNYFKNNKDGMTALKWWKDQCIKWCFARFEEGKYGDQKYLDYFPEKFHNITILKNRGIGVAPWNIMQYNISNRGKIKYKSDLLDIVFYHYHGIRIEIKKETLILKAFTFDITKEMESNIYIPYLNLVKEVNNKYLDKHIVKIKIEKRNLVEKIYSKIKKKLRNNMIAQFFYYKIFFIKYNGY